MKKIFLLSLILVMILVPVCYGRDPTEITDINQDGKITQSGVFPHNYVRDNTTGAITLDAPAALGYIEFNLTGQGIPAAAIIDQVKIMITTDNTIGPGGNVTLWSMTKQPSMLTDVNASNFQIWTDIGNGTMYVEFNATNVATERTRTLTGAETDVNLALGYFTIGIRAEPSGAGFVRYYSSLSANPPTLLIMWHLAGDYNINFTGLYYENGTRTGNIDITASIIAGNEVHNITGDTELYFPDLPTAFLWDIGGGSTRFIYGVGNESLTATYPEPTEYTYSFTIKDLTGNVGTDSFLEAYKIINGTETLITRMPIEQPNAVPMSLIFGTTYRMKIRFGDGSSYDWGFLIPGSDTTITLLLRVVEFSDGAQILYNHIFVDATRDAGVITVDYLDDRNNTIWANVSIRIRNGAVVQTYSRNNESYTINYAGFNDSLGYIVTVTGQHSDFGVWGRTFILDQSFTFPDAPDFSGIFGDAISNFIPFLLVCVTILIFPVSMQPIGLLGGGVMASMLSFFGWADWTFNLLAFYWFIAIIVNLTVSGRGT